MDFIERNLIEEPVPVYVLLAAVALVLLVLCRRRGSWELAPWLLAPLAAALGVFVLGKLVVTDRQQLEKNTLQIARGLETGDLAAVGTFLADDFHGAFGDRAAALRMAGKYLPGKGVRSIRVLKVEVTLDRPQATMKALTAIDLQSEIGPVTYTLSWTVIWVKRDGRWLIQFVEEPKN